MKNRKFCRLLDVHNATTGDFERQFILQAVPLPDNIALPAFCLAPRPAFVLAVQAYVEIVGSPPVLQCVILPFPAQVDVFTLLHFVEPAHCRAAYPLLQNMALNGLLLPDPDVLRRTQALLCSVLNAYTQAHPLLPE